MRQVLSMGCRSVVTACLVSDYRLHIVPLTPQHMCNQDVLHFLRLVSSSGAKWAFMTTFSTDSFFINSDIECASGGYRPMDLTKPPFSLPQPTQYFSEQYPLDDRVGLGLWTLPLW